MNTKKTQYPYVDEEKGLVYFNENFIVRQFVDVKWHSINKSHYISRGYTFTKMREILTVSVMDLTTGSHTLVTRICPICQIRTGANFYSLAKSNHTKCRGCTMIKNLVGNIYGRLTVIEQFFEYENGKKKPGTKWLCQCECGDTVIVRADCLTDGNTKSCGCYNMDNLHSLTGDKNPFWNPNLTDEERINRRLGMFERFSKPVFIRDNFTCQLTGILGCKLEAHHLNGFKDHIGQRWDISNGVALSYSIHKEFHKYMSSSHISCTRSDFIKFCNERYPNAPFLQNSDNLTDS